MRPQPHGGLDFRFGCGFGLLLCRRKKAPSSGVRKDGAFMQAFHCDALHDSPRPPGEDAVLPLGLGISGDSRMCMTKGLALHTLHETLQNDDFIRCKEKYTGITREINRTARTPSAGTQAPGKTSDAIGAAALAWGHDQAELARRKRPRSSLNLERTCCASASLSRRRMSRICICQHRVDGFSALWEGSLA